MTRTDDQRIPAFKAEHIFLLMICAARFDMGPLETHDSSTATRDEQGSKLDRLGINSLTVFGMPPVDYVSLTADLDCGHISATLEPVPWRLDAFPAWSLQDDLAMRREMKAVMRDRNIAIELAEGFAIRPQADIRDRVADLDLVAELGAQKAGAVNFEPDIPRALDQLGILADLALERKMTIAFEFAPPHPLNTLEQALAAITQISRPNAQLLIDAMHLFRTGGTVAALAAIDPQLIGYVQLCDAPLVGEGGDYYQEACFNRECPGQGELPLKDLLSIVSTDVPIGLEVPMQARLQAGIPLRQVVADLVTASRSLLRAVESE